MFPKLKLIAIGSNSKDMRISALDQSSQNEYDFDHLSGNSYPQILTICRKT